MSESIQLGAEAQEASDPGLPAPNHSDGIGPLPWMAGFSLPRNIPKKNLPRVRPVVLVPP